MVTQTVSIDSLKKVQTLVSILNNYSGRFELISGSSCVNAKSVMGIFSLDISRPVFLNIYNEDCATDVLQAIEANIR